MGWVDRRVVTEFDHVRYGVENDAAIITFDRPETLNAFNTGLLRELERGIERAEGEDGIRAIVLRGADGVFSAGNDFGEASGADGTAERLEAFAGDPRSRPGFVGHYGAIYQSPLPVIAAVEGYALAAACNVACLCDLTIAAEDAEFGFPDVRMGSLPGILVHPYVGVGIKHAKELLFSGERVDADEAERIGLVNRTVPTDELWERVMAEVDRIKLTPSTTVALSKYMLNDAMQRLGYGAPDGRLDRYLWGFSANTTAKDEFGRIQTEEGLEAAIEWMNTAEKR
jgi:enoyl-CoA hydratase/carnithine racemase